jgi:hypothetical protein
MTKIAGSGSGSISQRHGSADPDPPQNVMDPQHWFHPLDLRVGFAEDRAAPAIQRDHQAQGAHQGGGDGTLQARGRRLLY